MNRATSHKNDNTETQHHANPLSLFMSNLLSTNNSCNIKIEIVSDNAKKRASQCKIQRQSSRISIRRNQRWKCSGSSSSCSSSNKAPSSLFRKLNMHDLPQRRKSIERRESADSSSSWDISDDFDDDGVSSTVSLDDSYRSCDEDAFLGDSKKDLALAPAMSPVSTTQYEHALLMVQQKYGSPATTKRK